MEFTAKQKDAAFALARRESRKRLTEAFAKVEETLRAGEPWTSDGLAKAVDSRPNEVGRVLDSLLRRGWLVTARARGKTWWKWNAADCGCAAQGGPCRAWRGCNCPNRCSVGIVRARAQAALIGEMLGMAS